MTIIARPKYEYHCTVQCHTLLSAEIRCDLPEFIEYASSTGIVPCASANFTCSELSNGTPLLTTVHNSISLTVTQYVFRTRSVPRLHTIQHARFSCSLHQSTNLVYGLSRVFQEPLGLGYLTRRNHDNHSNPRIPSPCELSV